MISTIIFQFSTYITEILSNKDECTDNADDKEYEYKIFYLCINSLLLLQRKVK